jgi:hypothetical protein
MSWVDAPVSEPEWDAPNVRRRLRDRCRTYGLTVEDFRQMWTEQGGRCAICRYALTLRGACIDHYHDADRDTPARRTEQVRGLLCQGCNTSLPRYEDASDEEVEQQIAWVEELVMEAHRRLDEYLRARPLYMRAVKAYLSGTPAQVAHEDLEALRVGRRLPWRDSNWADAGFDLGNGLTMEFSEPRPPRSADE